MMRIGDNGGDTWKVARARQGLACSGSAAETNLQKNLPHPSTSEVGRFLRKRLVRRHGLPQRSVRRGHGPLGDRSLPRKSSGGLRGAKNQLSVTVLKPLKIARNQLFFVFVSHLKAVNKPAIADGATRAVIRIAATIFWFLFGIVFNLVYITPFAD
jgi:hypothetical protein